MRDLRRERGVDVQYIFWGETQTEVSKQRYLIRATVACQEWEGGVGTPVRGEVICELFRKLEPGRTGVGLFAVLLVSVGRAARGFDLGCDDREYGVGHARTTKGLFACVVDEVGE